MKNAVILPVAVVLTIFLGMACNSNTAGKNTGSTDVEFYPVSNFILSEISRLDSMPLAVLKKTTLNQSTDSAYISKEDFHQATRLFLEPDISDPRFRKMYTETVFMDATINALTLTYAATDTSAEIRKLDVLLDPASNQLNRIYMEKFRREGDSTITRKMTWKAGRFCQVITLVQRQGHPEMMRLEKYIWDERD